MKLKFIGATGTVTGSKYLLSCAGKQILVDCGLFQGYKELRLRNWDKLPFDPHLIDAIVLTHAHIDHSGYIPLIIKNGYKGRIYCTQATFDLCAVLLPDSGHLHEEDARLANKYHYSKHNPALPLYTVLDAIESLKHFEIVEFAQRYSLFDEVNVSWHRAGHILGASMIMVESNNTSVLFTGDMGRPNDPVMKKPVTITQTDYLVTESTYGDRLHSKIDPREEIGRVVRATAKRGGTVLIPSFAVGRAQTILYELYMLKMAKAIPAIPIYLDSPMAIDATKLFLQHTQEHKLSKSIAAKVCSIATYTNTPEESKAINNNPMPKIIISASGMATGGRVLHHLKLYAPDSRSTLLFTGYQAGGTRGQRILQGEKEIKIHGQIFPVNAQVEQVTNTSAHADYQELLDWYGGFTSPPRKVFITHGEADAAVALKSHIEGTLGWTCIIPGYLDEVSL